MMRALSLVALARITRTRRGRLPVIAWCALAIALAIVARTAGRSGGAGHLLVGPFGQAIVPLSAYAIVSAVFAGTGIRPAQRGLVALGAPPQRAALACVLVATAVSALVAGLLGLFVCSIAHGPNDPPLWSDLPATFGVAFMGGATYAAFFSAGSAMGRGALRSAFLVLDFILGAPAGFGAIFVPRGHLISLLGGPACFELSRRTSSLCLVLILAISLVIALRLGRRAGAR
jgi:hypothetical protein